MSYLLKLSVLELPVPEDGGNNSTFFSELLGDVSETRQDPALAWLGGRALWIHLVRTGQKRGSQGALGTGAQTGEKA